MTAKQTAIRNTARLLAVAVLAGAATGALLIHVPLPLLGIGVSVVVIVYLIHMIYELELAKAEHIQLVKQLNQDLKDWQFF